MVLLAGGLLLWLAGHADLTHWLLLVAVVLGGLPLIWNTMQQFLRQEFSVDVIALLAITGSLLLGQYLAGALIVLMLSGGEALEAYALRRARSSLSALAECAPIGANLEGHEG
jgi:cation transport ATPase